MCLIEIGLCVQNLLITLDSIGNIIYEENEENDEENG